MPRKKVKRKSRPIISGYLEKVSSNIFDKHQKAITDRTSGQQGLYALYRNDKLYYVGLAGNLRSRIKHHLQDRHKGKWTHFSLYIISHADHIKELESLLLRIAYPAGNKLKGKLRRSANILPDLKKQTREAALKEWRELFEKKRKRRIATTRNSSAKKTSETSKNKTPNQRPLYGCFPRSKVLYAVYKGKDYKAYVYPNGRIKFNGKFYDSPSRAGMAVNRKKTINGWKLWKYKNNNGKLVYIDELRK